MMIDFWVSAFWMAGHVVVIAASLVVWCALLDGLQRRLAGISYISGKALLVMLSILIVNTAIFRHYWLML